MEHTIKHGALVLATAVEKAYTAGQTDYNMKPVSLKKDNDGYGRIKDGDTVVFCCRRGEREIEPTEFFNEEYIDRVERRKLNGLEFVIMPMYHEKFKHLPIAFGATQVSLPLAEVLRKEGKTQLHCSESEEFAHVTFFLNGENNQAFPGEKDVCVPSIRGVPFDSKPELSLPLVADRVIDSLDNMILS